MGCYDYVEMKCPKCGELYTAQSKSGPCEFRTVNLSAVMDEVDREILEDANRHAPYKCGKCGTNFEVDVEKRQTIVSTYTEPHPESFQGRGGFGIVCPDGTKL